MNTVEFFGLFELTIHDVIVSVNNVRQYYLTSRGYISFYSEKNYNALKKNKLMRCKVFCLLKWLIIILCTITRPCNKFTKKENNIKKCNFEHFSRYHFILS